MDLTLSSSDIRATLVSRFAFRGGESILLMDEEHVMVWIFGAVAIPVFLWIAAPTMRSLFRLGWVPMRRNDAIVFQAQHSSSHG
jgi:hypothetical protein